MWFPDKKLDIAENRFKVNDKVIYVDKEGGEHTATVVDFTFKSLISGYSYAIVLDEPYNGYKNYSVSESRIAGKVKAAPKTKKSKKTTENTEEPAK